MACELKWAKTSELRTPTLAPHSEVCSHLFGGAITINLDLNLKSFVSGLAAKQHQQLILRLRVSPQGGAAGCERCQGAKRESLDLKKKKKRLLLLSFQSLISLGPRGGIFQHEPAFILSYKQVIYLALRKLAAIWSLGGALDYKFMN